MRILRLLTEDEMIAAFLGGELTSQRHGGAIGEQLTGLGQSPSLIAEPDLADDAQNELRRRIFSAARGYEQRTDVFGGFPDDVVWSKAEITKDELAQTRYIDYSYWNELTDGSRLPKLDTFVLDAVRADPDIYQDPDGWWPRTLEEADPIAPIARLSPLSSRYPMKDWRRQCKLPQYRSGYPVPNG